MAEAPAEEKAARDTSPGCDEDEAESGSGREADDGEKSAASGASANASPSALATANSAAGESRGERRREGKEKRK